MSDGYLPPTEQGYPPPPPHTHNRIKGQMVGRRKLAYRNTPARLLLAPHTRVTHVHWLKMPLPTICPLSVLTHRTRVSHPGQGYPLTSNAVGGMPLAVFRRRTFLFVLCFWFLGTKFKNLNVQLVEKYCNHQKEYLDTIYIQDESQTLKIAKCNVQRT